MEEACQNSNFTFKINDKKVILDQKRQKRKKLSRKCIRQL